MIGIQNVVAEKDFVRIELDDGFYLVLNRDGMIVGRGQDDDPAEHAHLDWEAADQIARTIMASKARS